MNKELRQKLKLESQIDGLNTAVHLVDIVLKAALKHNTKQCPIEVVEDLKQSLEHLVGDLRKELVPNVMDMH